MVETIREEVLAKLCEVLASTLTGREIGHHLERLQIQDGDTSTKRVRLYEALSRRQQRDRCGNNVIAFVHSCMDPIAYAGQRDLFEENRQKLNEILIFSGLSLLPHGRVTRVKAAESLDEAEQRASSLRHKLRTRNVHSDVLRHCRSELLHQNYFHAVFEATKSLAEKIRTRTGLPGDGSALVDAAFGLGKNGLPYLAFNALRTETEKSEHSGMMFLLKGIFSAFRNTTGHAPKISWNISEPDALDLLTIVSLLHRRLDDAIRTPRVFDQ